jgi:uncharacterized integral membrane protein
MKGKGILIVVLVALFGILLLQNSGAIEFRLYFWKITAPFFIWLMGVFLIGLVVGYLLAKVERRKGSKKAVPPAPEPPASSPEADL